ncbi:FMN-binding negative transcriptional regulator [Tistrella sp. BH-R2-4]|jgi:transcriptional regulator|uniref:FMN-binding negative transcriptional regulator n=1 Tax=Tistrella arctica TaxID=3133430 RepID=A0ABU9YLZ8_9PROT
MFVPDHYRNPHAAHALRWLARYPFGTLVTTDAGGHIHATSLPFIAEPAGDGDTATSTTVLISHMARRNPHGQALRDGDPALVVVNGPSAYISPRWYDSAQNVPTWDYVGLQFRGRLARIDDRAGLIDLMHRSIAAFEHGAADAGATEAGLRPARPWRLDDAPPAHVERLIQGVIGFRIVVERIDCMEKLSQNKPDDRPLIQKRLCATATPGSMAPAVAALMDAVI